MDDCYAGEIRVFLLCGSFSIILFAIIMGSAGADEGEGFNLTYQETSAVKVQHGFNLTLFNFTLSYNGPFPKVWVAFEITGIPNGTYGGFSCIDEYIGPPEREYFVYLKDKVYNVTVNLLASSGLLNDTYWMNVSFHLTTDSSVNCSHMIGLAIPQWAGVELVTDSWNPPEKTRPYTIWIKYYFYNIGNGFDRFSITSEFEREDLGWTIEGTSLFNVSGWTGPFPPDMDRKNKIVVRLKVTIPVGTLGWTLNNITVTVTSFFDPINSSSSLTTPLWVAQEYGFDVDVIGESRKTALPGSNVTFDFSVVNTGNYFDEFTIGPLWSAVRNLDFDVSVVSSTLFIAPNESQRSSLLVHVPEKPEPREYLFRVNVTSSLPDSLPTVVTFTVVVEGFYKIEVILGNPHQLAHPGKTVWYNTVVRNAGNMYDEYIISLGGVPAGWEHRIETTEISLDPVEERTVTIQVVVPTDFYEAPIGNYSISLLVISNISDGRSFLSLGIEVIKVTNVRWYLDGRAIEVDPIIGFSWIPSFTVNPYQQTMLDLQLEARNHGNSAERVDLFLPPPFSPSSGVSLDISTHSLDIAMGASVTVDLQIEVSLWIEPRLHSAAIFYEILGWGLGRRMVPINIDVVNVDVSISPTPTLVDPDGGDVLRSRIEVTGDGNLSFKLWVENLGDVTVNNVTVRGFDSYLVEGEHVRFEFIEVTVPSVNRGKVFIIGDTEDYGSRPIQWLSSIEGEHTLEFVVYYEHQSNVTNDVSNVTVIVNAPEVPDPERWLVSTSWILFISLVFVCIVVVVTYLLTSAGHTSARGK